MLLPSMQMRGGCTLFQLLSWNSATTHNDRPDASS